MQIVREDSVYLEQAYDRRNLDYLLENLFKKIYAQ